VTHERRADGLPGAQHGARAERAPAPWLLRRCASASSNALRCFACARIPAVQHPLCLGDVALCSAGRAAGMRALEARREARDASCSKRKRVKSDPCRPQCSVRRPIGIGPHRPLGRSGATPKHQQQHPASSGQIHAATRRIRVLSVGRRLIVAWPARRAARAGLAAQVRIHRLRAQERRCSRRISRSVRAVSRSCNGVMAAVASNLKVRCRCLLASGTFARG
jgi:hypothetical protein